MRHTYRQLCMAEVCGGQGVRLCVWWRCVAGLPADRTGSGLHIASCLDYYLISKIVRIIARLYSSYPSEVVSVLLELFQLQIPGFSESIDMEHSDDSNIGASGSTSSMDELKSIIIKLSSKRPRLLLSMLKNVLEMIEVSFEKIQKGEYDIYSSQDHSNIHHMSNLCSLSPWLIMNIKMLKDSGLIRLIDEAEVLPIHKNTLPKVSLSMLLRKCLILSVHDKHLLDSVRLLVEMLGDTSVKERLKKLPLLSLKSTDSMEGPTYPDTGSMLLQEEDAVKNATDNLEIMKLNLKSRRKRINGSDSDTTSTWTIAKSWTSCPIGMLPCSFSSTAVLPVLDKFDNELETDVGENKHTVLGCSAASDGLLDCHTEPLEVGNAFKKLKPSLDDVQCVDCSETTCPMEGRLLIHSMWIKVSEEELQAIKSNIRTFR
ncbi:Las1-like [Musa troglodytarum]|uniref:Las1-like n=1 Tax=Musa troglodytarum TaxID=320322 RepID=A0A9E7EUA7_9LILI|nr:Las1-like [Musa troglodytarum]